MKEDPPFWVEDTEEQFSVPVKRKRQSKVKKLEYIGWGSKPLIEFLDSIGIDMSKQLTQKEVSSLIIQYVTSNNLHHPQKKKRVLCDDRLHALFGKKFVSRLKIYDLLEVHFAENHDESEEEPYSSEEDDGDDGPNSFKEKKATTSGRKLSHEKKNVHEAPKSCFAAVIPENIKLVYLQRSVIQEVLKIPESVEEKIKGSFVRVKSDPNDYLQKHAYQLQQVTGTRKISQAGNDGIEILLQVINSITDIPLLMLSNDNFSEEECEDLRERVKAGLIKRPTVVELDAKAKILHEDITKHWIAREIALLQTRIDRANEKGWRRELYEYRERKKLLETDSEKKRLLREMPKVIAEELEPQPTPVDTSTQAEPSSRSPALHTCRAVDAGILDAHETPEQVEEIEDRCVQQDKELPDVSIYENQSEERLDENSGKKGNSHVMPESQVSATQVIELSDDDDDEDEAAKPEKRIRNSDKDGDLRDSTWHYLDPQGEVQGPFSIASLKSWRDQNYFSAGFMVWKEGQSKEKAVLLTDVIRQVFPG